MPEIESEIEILEFLMNNEINVVQPIKRLDGDYISVFNTFIGDIYGVMYLSVGEHDFDEIEEDNEKKYLLG